jgi:hypothetical protein
MAKSSKQSLPTTKGGPGSYAGMPRSPSSRPAPTASTPRSPLVSPTTKPAAAASDAKATPGYSKAKTFPSNDS